MFPHRKNLNLKYNAMAVNINSDINLKKHLQTSQNSNLCHYTHEDKERSVFFFLHNDTKLRCISNLSMFFLSDCNGFIIL